MLTCPHQRTMVMERLTSLIETSNNRCCPCELQCEVDGGESGDVKKHNNHNRFSVITRNNIPAWCIEFVRRDFGLIKKAAPLEEVCHLPCH